MPQILNVKDTGVTVGVYDKTLAAAEHWVQVTFSDIFGNVRTVFAHKEGPFKTAEDIVKAAVDGVLHVEIEHPEGHDEPQHPAGPVIA